MATRMRNCDTIRAQIVIYLDDELHDGELTDFESHLRGCPACNEQFERERRVLEGIRASKPLYAASPELRSRIVEILIDSPDPYIITGSLRQRVNRILRLEEGPLLPVRLSRVLMYTIALSALFIAAYWLMTTRRQAAATSEFALMAIDTHQRRLRNQLPLEINSDSPVKISDWFAGKVSFRLELPNFQEASGQEKLYRLEGARLVGFK